MKNVNNRGQTEIIGVAIIVVILVIAGAIFLTMQTRNRNTGNNFTDPELAQSLLNAIMNTKTEKNVIVSDIIKDCYSNRNDLCGSTSTSDCCEYAYQTMRNALESTLGKWQRSYRLTVTKGTDKRIKDIPENSKCNDFSEQEQPGVYYIPPPPPIVITLQICKS
jgi:hypothetical protein